jgi:hypothetical protein
MGTRKNKETAKHVKQLCLGVAVAGVFAGAGSVVTAAVAHAEPTSSDSVSSSESAQAGSAQTRSAQTRSAQTRSAAPASRASRATVAKPTASQPARRRAAALPTSAAVVPAAPVPVPALPTPIAPAAPASAATVNAASIGRGRSASIVASAVAEPTHVLLIGTDGTNMSKVLEYAYDEPTSGFRILMDQGVTGTTSFVGHTTLSGPSWSTILTGAWDNKTGVFNNIFSPVPYNSWPTAINLIEYNTRMGDPETQVVMPRLAEDLVELCLGAADGSLVTHDCAELEGHAVCVVATSAGYPGPYAKAIPFEDLAEGDGENTFVFHAGTAQGVDGKLVTNGGRVVAHVALGASLEEARNGAYDLLEGTSFEGMQVRRDIGLDMIAFEKNQGA